MIERSAKKDINNWILNGKDALLLTGARQIGKTYLIRQCLEESELPHIELNFIDRPELVELFAGARDTEDLLLRLSMVADQPLEKGKTIILLKKNMSQRKSQPEESSLWKKEVFAISRVDLYLEWN